MKLFEGVYTALVTPFLKGKVDFVSLEKLLSQQLNAGVHGFIVNGTTGESPTLQESEAFEILQFVKEKTKNRAKIVFGSGLNSTEKTIELSQKAAAAGAEGLLVVVPYYNKPPQTGLFQHFKAVAESVSCPVMLYNVPGRTVTSLAVKTIADLTKVKNVQAIKEASGNLEFDKELMQSPASSLIVSSGDDDTCFELRRLGGRGVVSVCSHIMPQFMVKCFTEDITQALSGEFDQAKPLLKALCVSTNPIPVKAALHIMGILQSDELRLPLTTLEADQRKILEKALKDYERFLG